MGAVHTISFSSVIEDADDMDATQLDNRDDRPFKCNDFIVVDDNARITLLKASLF